MYEYYRGQTVAPTFGNLRDESALERFNEHRVDLYVNKLSLPVRLFNGAEVLEFGPDTGEHALIFARWGAELTLVEPNPDAVRQIKAYFKRFRMEDRLKAVIETDIAGFASDRRSLSMITDNPDATSAIVALLSKLEGAMRLIGEGKVDDLIRFTNTDRDFIDAWGLPVHFSVFRKARG